MHRLLTFSATAALKDMPLGDKLHRLATLSPEDVIAIDLLVTERLKTIWDSGGCPACVVPRSQT